MGDVVKLGSNYTLSKVNIGFFVFLHAGALAALFPPFFSWSGVALMLLFYWLTASLGICMGFHRYLTHRSFDSPQWMANIFVTFGALACQNGPIKWTAHHRMHHAYSDTTKDPHNAKRGFWWSHMGWMMFWNDNIDPPEIVNKWTRDINENRYYRFLDNNYIKIQIALGLTFLALGGWSWVFWGVFFRLVLVYHVTWFVNSASHMFGYKNFLLEKDLSTNCWWVGLLAMGEGWHNNHHAHPQSARHGLRPWEFDVTWLAISLMQKLGLATNVKVVAMSPLPKESEDESQVWFSGEIVHKAA